MINTIKPYLLLMRLDKPIGILLLLWPTLWALWVASAGQPDQPDPWVFVVFVAGVILMRSAGCVINDYADRKVDPHVARTQNRPIASGQVSPKAALILFAVLCLLAFALVLTMNWLTIGLSVIGALLAASYPFMKRYTHLPQAYLGAAFGWAVPMAFAAQTGSIPCVAWLLFAVTLIWAMIYDTQYAMVDRDDDIKIGVKSTAILFGRHDKLIIGLLQLTMLGMLGALCVWQQYNWHFAIGLLCIAGLFLYQQWLIRNRDREACFQAFLNNNWVGVALFFGLLASY